MRTLLYSLLLIAIVLFGLISLALYWTFVKSAPDYDETISSGFLNEQVRISRDDYGVPSIDAAHIEDAYFALGYIHAQDRLWQLTIQQIALQGRHSEFFGEANLDLDRFSRMMRFNQMGEDQLELLSQEELRLLRAYTSGINQFIERGPAYYPLEFSITQITPLKWEPHHVLAMMKMKAWSFSTAEAGLTASILADELPPEIWQDLFPDAPVPEAGYSTTFAEEPAKKLLENSRAFQHNLGWSTTPSGSNAWVIPADQTNSGYPVLAADPHASLTIPSPWYETEINVNNRTVSGFTTPGIPVFFTGRNESLSWAFTNSMAADAHFISYADTNTTPAQQPESSIADHFETRREILRVNGDEETLIELTDSPYGPVINSLYEELSTYAPLVLNWQGFSDHQDFSGWHHLAFATDHNEFEAAAGLIRNVPVHLFYADRQGVIDQMITGDLPEYRSPGSILHIYEFESNPPGIFEGLHRPDAINEGEGYLYNANQAFTVNGFQPGHFFEPGERADRINFLLNEFSGRHNIATSRALQQDITSHYAVRINEQILPILREYSTDPDIEKALEYLENWNYSYSPSATAATVFDQFLLELGREIFGRVLDDEYQKLYGRHDFFPYKSILHILQNGSVLLDPDLQNPDYPSEVVIIESMREAIAELSRTVGVETFEWGWENVHQISFIPFAGSILDDKLENNPGMSMVRQSLLDRGPFPHGGHSTTINQGKYDWNRPFMMTHGASFRFITDLGSDAYYAILSTGQSGNPISDFYDDQIPSWKDGNYRIVQIGDVNERPIKHIMRIIPE